jgi:hypothetical protein
MARSASVVRVPAQVSAPPEPYRSLLITWPLRQLRNGLRVPSPGKRSDDWAWEYEQRWGIGNVFDRSELLRDVFDRLRRAGQVDIDRVVVVLGDVRQMAAMTYGATRKVESQRGSKTRSKAVNERNAVTERRQAEKWLQRIIDRHETAYVSLAIVELPQGCAPYRAALAMLAVDPLVNPKRERTRPGSPRVHVLADARKALAALGISPDDARDLLEAIGVLQ